MVRTIFHGLVYLAALTVTGTACADGPTATELGNQAMEILRTRCHRCHSGDGSEGGAFDAVSHVTYVKRADGTPVVLPGKLAESKLWKLIESGKMPPKEIPADQRPTPAEVAIVKQWIEQGAAAPGLGEQARRHIPIPAMLESMRGYMRTVRPELRTSIRFFTLTHLHNLPSSQVRDADLQLYRAALSKAINSLSWKPRIVIPRAIDPAGTIFAVNIADLDWTRDRATLWGYIAARYPYGMTYDESPDEHYRIPYMELAHLCGTKLPAIRADWFIACATRPPLYDDLMQLPHTLYELEKLLGVDVIQSYQDGTTHWAGFAKSGVSGQNRHLRRYDSRYGAYWISDDFKEDNPRRNLLRYPFGPSFRKHPHSDLVFDHDGGEVIFHLPNGLQAYMLLDGKGKKINTGPIVVVNDPLKTSGTPEIVNGLSCMACHKHGVITDFKDEVRTGSSAAGAALIKVRQLYVTPEVLQQDLNGDRERFMNSLKRTIGPFLQVGPNKDVPIEQFPEPIGEIARMYRLQNLDAITAAAELGLPGPDELVLRVKSNRLLVEKGLGPLANGGRIKRFDWEELRGTSLMQQFARELNEQGSPFNYTLPKRRTPESGPQPTRPARAPSKLK